MNLMGILSRQAPLSSEIRGSSHLIKFLLTDLVIQLQCRRILHDPNVFSQPHRFNPDRFMQEKGDFKEQHLSPTDPLSVAFGYGRRLCPGRHMGEAQVWINIASILSALSISSMDESGVAIPVKPEFSSKGLIW